MCAVQDARRDGLARGGDLPFPVLEQVLNECAGYQPILDFIGGEPLLYAPLPEAIRLAEARNLLSVVTTNGLKLREQAARLVEAGLPLLQISLDGWDEQSQEARGGVKGSFARICEGVRAIQEARARRRFPIIRIVTAITRVNHAQLDRIGSVVRDLNLRYWSISNYFYLNRSAQQRQVAFALQHGLDGQAAAHVIQDDMYLLPDQVQALRAALARVRDLNRELKINYAWDIDLDRYYSPLEASPRLSCELPNNRLDVHTDGQMAVCVSGKRVGKVGVHSIAEVWKGQTLEDFRAMYQRKKPMPMCFRCCGLSQSIRFDS
jgi:MoaA/NifB/PqqE/SkfB family radical SAM enzyme